MLDVTNVPGTCEPGFYGTFSACPCTQHGQEYTVGGCQACPAGSYTNNSGQTECTPCEVGKFQEVTGSVECEDVDVSSNQYQNETGQTTPKDCAVCGTDEYIYTACTAISDTECSACSPCEDGEYIETPCATDADTVCSACTIQDNCRTPNNTQPCVNTNKLYCDAANNGYHNVGGVVTQSFCNPPPDSPLTLGHAYNTSDQVAMLDVTNVPGTCEPGFYGTFSASPCTQHGQEYTVSGCEACPPGHIQIIMVKQNVRYVKLANFKNLVVLNAKM